VVDYIKTKDGHNLYFKRWGEGRPIIMMHGWPLSADSWDDLSLALADAGFCAISYDRRGFGRSSQPWTGYDYDTFADDLAAVMEHCEARDATIMGFSMGGGEVARYMSRHGGKNVAQAALLGSVVPYLLKDDSNPQGVDQSVFDQMMQGIKDDRPAFLAGFFNDFYAGNSSSPKVSQQVIQWSINTAMMAGLIPTLGCVKAFSSTDFRPDLEHFKVPTLIIHGTDDKIVPIDVSSRVAAQGIQNSEFIEYDGAPHGLFATHKERLTRDVLEFVKS
jgi:non-heme chloroperoxidase